MLKEYRTVSFLFFIGLVLQIAIGFFGSVFIADVVQLIVFSLLVVFFWYETGLKGRFHKRMFYAFIMALLALIFGITGLGSSIHWNYLIGCQVASYLFFVRAFYLDFSSAPELDKKGAKIAIVVTGLFSIGIYFYLRPYLGKIQVLVLCLTLLISFMIMMAAFRNKRVNSFSFISILMAVVLLAMYNLLHAISLFVYPLTAVMLVDDGILSVALYLMILGGVSRKLITFQADS